MGLLKPCATLMFIFFKIYKAFCNIKKMKLLLIKPKLLCTGMLYNHSIKWDIPEESHETVKCISSYQIDVVFY